MSKFTAVTSQLHTIADYCRYGATLFNQAELFYGHGSDNAFNDAYILVMYALSLPNDTDDSIMSCRLIETEKVDILGLFTRRIEEQIPVAYITNVAYFAQLPFYVDERVLIPRSPIGELIETKFSPYIAQNNPPKRILDLCTGSGCIAIACASYFDESEIDAVDLSIDALNVAQINIENHGLCEQVIPIQSDIFSGVEGQSYDLIVSNPPYVDQQDIDSLPQEYHHEPEMGLGCGEDGLDIVRVILAESANHLNDEGLLFCEVGNSEVHVKALYPDVPFTWLDFERGGHGVFMLTKAQLIEFSDVFVAALKHDSIN
ncbi:50S ribosomal protein L3 N(5)-glutamine methyltransferase [Colwellia sp. 1_MG-2023]|jgi:ribosomal protein L3 glutamine methyltransferase|uniref:50S ribosomal protein L3 N(5)-glutamine methyltransferase n=1 Tax=unclassified Colwellia TaxID=196834 RepID=UPI001C09A099|nr:MULTISPECIES: 50S ribosomal protein L3 N(5)-glutamine methyltransferase [unclassified Colwellia]MBU2926554.1 50S ribosomal protein L3 N(5)-glutamine methyltransferase [Colwellia sp. C2M11]MDO6487513.1 50S ribosomal protein L3 N(5)-glutamine methyltransferase [Colwellia sp. 6_MG-2023]MDO6652592.1 50S ribosomal protein L3 N(5)-glutamine methyltransferase [Colwellia sp. 3_MG-2023]MDO6665193.1 50S ribosomal protein L3 N(5)-glutamine methyltransferase [Colwellia sp. 2_MG-2023]MDO6689485.1 50S ri